MGADPGSGVEMSIYILAGFKMQAFYGGRLVYRVRRPRILG